MHRKESRQIGTGFAVGVGKFDLTHWFEKPQRSPQVVILYGTSYANTTIAVVNPAQIAGRRAVGIAILATVALFACGKIHNPIAAGLIGQTIRAASIASVGVAVVGVTG